MCDSVWVHTYMYASDVFWGESRKMHLLRWKWMNETLLCDQVSRTILTTVDECSHTHLQQPHFCRTQTSVPFYQGSHVSWNVLENHPCPGMTWKRTGIQKCPGMSWKITTVLEKCPGKWVNRIKLWSQFIDSVSICSKKSVKINKITKVQKSRYVINTVRNTCNSSFM